MNNWDVLFLTDLFSEGHLVVVVTTTSTWSPWTFLQGCLTVMGGMAQSQEKKVTSGTPKEKQAV